MIFRQCAEDREVALGEENVFEAELLKDETVPGKSAGRQCGVIRDEIACFADEAELLFDAFPVGKRRKRKHRLDGCGRLGESGDVREDFVELENLECRTFHDSLNRDKSI